jgi:hypothetical protein
MKPLHLLQGALLAAAVFTVPLAQAITPMGRADYQSARERIGDTYKADRAACASQAGNARDICIEKAKGQNKVALAQLEFDRSGKPADDTKLRVAKADADYAVAKEKCDDLAGNAKDVCRKEASAVQVKALADARTSQKIHELRKDSADDKRDADYQVATQKCQALAGSAKDSCMASAKLQFGKS